MMRRVFTVLLGIFLLPWSGAVAQQILPLASGERVRIRTVDAEKIVGRVEHTRNEIILISHAEGSVQREVPLRSISSLDVRRRASRGQGAWKWAKRGFAVGAAIGAVSCGVEMEQCRESAEMGEAEIVFGSALFVGGGVAFLGAIGGTLFPGGRWERILVPEHARLMPDTNGGIRLSVAWRF